MAMRNIVKILEKNFCDMRAGDKMFIASPEAIADYIKKIPKGRTVTVKEMRRAFALAAGADNTCPTTTGLFLRMALEGCVDSANINASPLPFWRLVDEKHPVLKKLGIPAAAITRMRQKEAL